MPGLRSMRLLAGVIAFALWIAPAAADSDEWRRLMDAAMRSHQHGNFAIAETKLRAALELAEGFGSEDRRVPGTLAALAVVYYEQEQYAQAEPLLLRALAIVERILGPDHPELAPGFNGLALLYTHQGRYEQAEPMFRRALALFEKGLGPEDLNVARVLDNLGGVLTADGRYEEAEPLYRRALPIMEKALGPRHPDVAKILEFYANTLQMLGRAAEADELYARAKEITAGRGGTGQANRPGARQMRFPGRNTGGARRSDRRAASTIRGRIAACPSP